MKTKRIAITGGTGFVGHHVAKDLLTHGHDVVLISRSKDTSPLQKKHPDRVRVERIGLSDPIVLAEAFESCDAVVHCAGINREVGEQTYQAVHIDGTHSVVKACRAAGVPKLSMISFLRARPNCNSAYHESKHAAEELVRDSDLNYTVFKAGVIYGKGDHMLDHLSHAFHTFPVFAFVGMKDQLLRPLAVEDFARMVAAAAMTDELDNKTLAVTGPEELTLSAAVKRVANAVGKHPRYYFRAPLWFHYALAWICETTMKVPLVSLGQVRILAEGVTEPCGDYELPPIHLRPNTPFMESFIRTQLPEPRGFGLRDLRLSAATL